MHFGHPFKTLGEAVSVRSQLAIVLQLFTIIGKKLFLTGANPDLQPVQKVLKIEKSGLAYVPSTVSKGISTLVISIAQLATGVVVASVV